MVAWSLQTRRRLVVLLNVVLLVSIGGLLCGSVTTSPAPRESASKPDEAKRPSPVKPIPPKPLSFYLAAARVPLRRPLVDPPAPSKPLPEKTVIQKTSLRAKLTGTIIDAEHAYGIFINAAGEEIPLTVGETIDGAELVQVKSHSATLKYRNTMVLLELPREEDLFK